MAERKERTMTIVKTMLVGAVALALAAPASAQQKTQIKFMLDWKYQAVHSWYFVAQQKGYFARENLEVTIDQGAGGAATTNAVISGAYQIGIGEANSLIQVAATRQDTPVAIYMLFNSPPFALITKADGPIKTLKDLEGRTVAGAAGGSTIRLFPMLARLNNVDPAKVKIMTVAPQLQEQVVVNGSADASTVFNQTAHINLIGMKLDPDKYLRWFHYKDFGINLYSNTIIVSAAYAKANLTVVKGFLRAVNAGLKDVIKNPDEGIKALVAVEPLTNATLEKQRLIYTFDHLMLNAETAEIGLGDIKDDRMQAAITQVTDAFGLPRKPAVNEIFDRSYLPPKADRTYK
jgi:NitT/TauT family transport system substrate-binding protein